MDSTDESHEYRTMFSLLSAGFGQFAVLRDLPFLGLNDLGHLRDGLFGKPFGQFLGIRVILEAFLQFLKEPFGITGTRTNSLE